MDKVTNIFVMRIKPEEIVVRVGKLFKRFGIKSITMDDIALELGISKKTLYQYINDKDQLVADIIDQEIASMESILKSIQTLKKDAVFQMLKIMDFMTAFMSDYSPVTLLDLKKYYLPSYEKIRSAYFEILESSILNNISLGKAEGLYRIKANDKIVSRLLISRFDKSQEQPIMNEDELSLQKILEESSIYHIRGIASEKGVDMLNRYIEKQIFRNQTSIAL